MRKKIKLHNKQIVKITKNKGDDLAFWRSVLLTCNNRSLTHRILVDEDVRDIVEADMANTLNEGTKRLEKEIKLAIDQRQGRSHRSGWGAWSMLMPKWFDVFHHLGAELLNKLSTELLINNSWRTQLPNYKDGTYLRLGEISQEIIHVGGRVKMVIMPVMKAAPVNGKAGDIIDREQVESNWWQWRGLRGDRLFSHWLRQTDDESIALLYAEFPSCTEIREELVRRSQDFHVSDDLRPRVSFSKIGKIGNAELRRTLMTVGIVSGYPHPLAVDDEGELFQLDFDTKVLKLTCPSTGRIYHLGVPSSMETPREARRWTLGLPEGAEIIAET